MIFIVCDMNCNNWGNFFEAVGLERELEQDEYSYKKPGGSWPKKHCYRSNRFLDENSAIRYSKAIDYLIPEDYVRWKKERFGE